MDFAPKFENKELSRETTDTTKEWQERIKLSDDMDKWQNSLNLTDDIENTPILTNEKRDIDFSQYEEAKQVERVVEYINSLSDIKHENWINLSVSERINIIQKIEIQAAKAGCRTALTVETAPMSANDLGCMDWKNQKIIMNERLIISNDVDEFRQCIKTLIHEGRHAYQYSNVSIERNEPNAEKYQSWVINLATGYCAAKLLGLKRYYLQPLEVDARVFSESVVSKIKL